MGVTIRLRKASNLGTIPIAAMSRNELGRVLDPSALDASAGPRAYACVVLPSEWLERGCEFEISVKARLLCARCEGGGCESCHRSGALRAPDDPAQRTLRLQLPKRPAGNAGTGLALRVPNPFGALANIEQLLVEIRGGAPTSPNVRKIRELDVEYNGIDRTSRPSPPRRKAKRKSNHPTLKNQAAKKTTPRHSARKRAGHPIPKTLLALALACGAAFVLWMAR